MDGSDDEEVVLMLPMLSAIPKNGHHRPLFYKLHAHLSVDHVLEFFHRQCPCGLRSLSGFKYARLLCSLNLQDFDEEVVVPREKWKRPKPSLRYTLVQEAAKSRASQASHPNLRRTH